MKTAISKSGVISLSSVFPCLLHTGASFSLYLRNSRHGLWSNNWWANQEKEEMGFGKEAPVGQIPHWPLTSMWGGMAHIIGACGLLCHCWDTTKTPVAWSHLFEEQTLWQRRKTNDCHSGLASTVDISSGHWCPSRS